MVNIDTVYQRVLALANKEQRGYITPQEFNLFANQAQMDIFEQYFYDLNLARKFPSNDTVYADIVNLLEDKIDLFRATLGSAATAALVPFGIGYRLPDDIYRMEMVRMGPTPCEKLTAKEYNSVRFTPLTKPTPSRPIYTIRSGNTILINDGVSSNGNGYVNFQESPINMYYIKKPTKANWTYIVVGDKPLYNNGAEDHNHFELHASEETKLVIKILALAGITLKDPNLYQIASSEDNKNIQQEKQ